MNQDSTVKHAELKHELLLEVIGAMNIAELRELLDGLLWRVWPVAAIGDFVLGIERSNTDLEPEVWAREIVLKLESGGLHVLGTLWSKVADR